MLANSWFIRNRSVLLDEPTNHLDLETLDWLEQFLLGFEGAIVVVSHDRYFLDRICNAILEVQDAHVKGYIGDYSSFLKQRPFFYRPWMIASKKRKKSFDG